MNRTFHKPLGSLEIDVVTIYGSFAVGASGAPTIDTQNSKGVASVARNSAGKYTVTLSEPVQKFLFGNVVVEHNNADNVTTAGVIWRQVSNGLTAATPTWVVQFVSTTDGGAVDVANGATVYFKLELRNSTVG